MAYTSNVPQGNQQIAATQAPILANFTFLSTGIGTEHNFNAAGTGSDMYHLQASMPNRAGGDPGSLPSGTNGMYYVLGGIPKFYNTNGAFPIAFGNVASLTPFNGSVSINVNQTLNISPTISGNIAGLISVQRSDDGDFSSWVFISNTTSGFGQEIANIADSDSGHILVIWNGTSLALKNTGSQTYTFKYSGYYYPTV